MTQSYPPQKVEARSGFGLLFVAGLIVAAFLLIGLALSAFFYSVTPKVFESSATVLIEQRSPPRIFKSTPNKKARFMVRHDQLIGEDNIVTKGLKKYDLEKLTTLRDLPTNDQIIYIQSNFEARQSDENLDMYELSFRSRNARDAQTILATLVSTYEKHLEEKYGPVRSDTRELLLKMEQSFANDVASFNEKIEQVETRIALGQNGDELRPTLKKLQEEP